MNFKLLDSNIPEHCGTAAVFSVVTNLLNQDGSVVGEGDEHDALVVIGGGVMHHGDPAFHEKMQHIAKAQTEGKETYLLNSIWQDNPSLYNGVLSTLDGIAVRGLCSQSDLSTNHGIGAQTRIDLCFFAQIDESALFTDVQGATVAVQTLADNPDAWQSMAQQEQSWRKLDARNMSWSSLVKTLRTAGLVVTDQDHVIYAACKARVPFVPVRHKTHGLSDLFETARAPIAICDTYSQISNMRVWAPQNRGPFDRLFDWMEAQTKPIGFKDVAPPRSAPIKPVGITYAPNSLAIMANAIGENILAGNLWERAADAARDPINMLVNAGSSYFRGGNIERGAELLFEARFAAPEEPKAGQNVHFYFPIASNWIHNDTVSGWNDGWAKIAEQAVSAANQGNDPTFFKLAGYALDQAMATNSLTAAAARQYIAARLVALYRQDLAWKWWNEIFLPAIPEWMHQEDRFWLTKWIGLYSPSDKAQLDDLRKLPAWNNASYLRAGINDYLWTMDGAHTALTKKAITDAKEFPEDQALFSLALKISLAAGEHILAKQLVALNLPFALNLGRVSAPVAEFLLKTGIADPALPPLAALAKQARFTEMKMRGRLADRSKRIAVVGNSPNEIGAGHGGAIDSYDEVVRFNRFNLGEQYYRDYGRKTSVVFAVGHTSSLRELYGKLPAGTTLALSTDKRLYQEQHWQALADLSRDGFEFCFALADERAELTRKLGKFASTGLTFCYYLKKLRGKLDRHDFYGFSFTDQLRGGRYNYFSDNKGSEAHDWASERDLFEALFKN